MADIIYMFDSYENQRTRVFEKLKLKFEKTNTRITTIFFIRIWRIVVLFEV